MHEPDSKQNDQLQVGAERLNDKVPAAEKITLSEEQQEALLRLRSRSMYSLGGRGVTRAELYE